MSPQCRWFFLNVCRLFHNCFVTYIQKLSNFTAFNLKFWVHTGKWNHYKKLKSRHWEMNGKNEIYAFKQREIFVRVYLIRLSNNLCLSFFWGGEKSKKSFEGVWLILLQDFPLHTFPKVCFPIFNAWIYISVDVFSDLDGNRSVQ